MQRPLGSTGLTVSALGFGCGNVGGLMIRGSADEQRAAVARAIEGGITYFDTAPSYGDGASEEHLGRTLRDLDAWDDVVVGTKLSVSSDDAKTAVRRSLTASLRRLGRDTVDLIQLHDRVGVSQPRALAPQLVVDEVAPAMRAMVDEGLVRHIGFTGLGETDAVHEVVASGAFDTVQAYVNVLNPSGVRPGIDGDGQDFDGLIARAADQEMSVIAIRVLAAGAVSGSADRAPHASPAGGGRLAGSEFEADIERARSLEPLAQEFGLADAMEMSLRFVVSTPGVSTALVGLSDIDQLEAALRWVGRGPLPADAVRRITGA